MSRIARPALALAVLVALCGSAVADGASRASTPVLKAPAATVARAAADARAALSAVSLPAGSQALPSAPHALAAEPGGPDLTQPYATFKTATAYWRLASAAAASALLAQARHPAISETGPGDLHLTQIMLATEGAWMGPRWLTIETKPGSGGHWLAELQGVAVWTPYRLELPSAVAAVSVRRLQDGSLLADVRSPAQVARLVAAVNALAVDDAIHAVYACPAEPVGKRPGFQLSFLTGSGAVLATATTVACPPDVALRVGTHGPQELILGGLAGRLQKILRITLPPAF
jgi:hypothetical protein